MDTAAERGLTFSMEPSCPADAFNIRKRKQFRKKDADLASSSLWGRKEEEEEGEMVKSFVFSSDGERREVVQG